MPGATRIANYDGEIPAIAGSYVKVAVSTTAVVLADEIGTIEDHCSHIRWSVDGADVRLTTEGTDPTNGAAGNGHTVLEGVNAVWSLDAARPLKFIRKLGTDAVLHIEQLSQ